MELAEPGNPAKLLPQFPQTRQVKQQALQLGFHKVGIAAVPDAGSEPLSAGLKHWLGKGYEADMAWMHHPARQEIRAVMPEVRSVICVALNYYTDHERSPEPHTAKISRYGWGRDYHRVMGKRLKALARWLEEQDENIRTRFYVDTGPVQDKVWAERAGIGWIAKNSNVITREYGSWVFLGEVLTNLDLTPDAPHTAHCGTCTRCLDACPTEAIAAPFTVDANRCIAYHTIENRAASLPEPMRSSLHGWVAGCDICQDVCPWNERFAKETDIADFQPYPENVNPTLEELSNISEDDWSDRFRASALRRIKPEMLRRNAVAALDALSQTTTNQGE